MALRPLAPVPSLPCVLLPALACALAVSRMLLLHHPIQPEGRVVAVVAVSERVRRVLDQVEDVWHGLWLS